MNKLICITGLPGAGKSVVADYFKTKGYQFVRFGQIVLDKIKKQNLVLNEVNEKKIRERIRKEHGMSAFAILNYSKFVSLLKKGNVIADGMYSWEEYKYLKDKFGKRMIVIAVYAPPGLRYERISKRKMPKSDKELRNRPFSKKEAKARDFAELENLNKGPTIAMADYTIVNTKDLRYLMKQIKEIFQEINKKN